MTKRKEIITAREVALAINEEASEADRNEAYNTELYVRIPGIGLRYVRAVRLDEDCCVVLDLSWLSGDQGKPVTK